MNSFVGRVMVPGIWRQAITPCGYGVPSETAASHITVSDGTVGFYRRQRWRKVIALVIVWWICYWQNPLSSLQEPADGVVSLDAALQGRSLFAVTLLTVLFVYLWTESRHGILQRGKTTIRRKILTGKLIFTQLGKTRCLTSLTRASRVSGLTASSVLCSSSSHMSELRTRWLGHADIFILLPSRLTLRLLMSYIYGAPILDVSRSHTTTQHSR